MISSEEYNLETILAFGTLLLHLGKFITDITSECG